MFPSVNIIFSCVTAGAPSKFNSFKPKTIMKPLRIYHTRSAWVWCRVDFVVSDQDWQDDPELAATLERYSITMRAAVLYRAPSSDRDCPDRFHVRAHPNIPRDIVFREATIFLSTLKHMYDL